MEPIVANHCAVCGKLVEPEKQFCSYCATHQEPCPVCNNVICDCEVAPGD